MKVIYGTSDWFLNFTEVLLTLWVAEETKNKTLFFYYPKGTEWLAREKQLFEPYKSPVDEWCDFKERIELITLQEITEGELGNVTLGEITEMIRKEREIQAFRAINFPDRKPIFVSSKDREWQQWRNVSLRETINNSRIKLGGSFIYFIYGFWLAKNENTIGILPNKQYPDVVGAFEAGQKFVGKKAKVIRTGEFDFMTKSQWEMWEKDRKWRKVPMWVVEKLLETREVAEEIQERVVIQKVYTPLEYDEKLKKFYLKEDLL